MSAAVVAIDGPSASGKTTFIRRLKIQLEVNGLHPRGLSLDNYYCDRELTPRGPDGDYEACKVYRRFLKNSKNPFRSSDGKKLNGKRLLQLYVE